MTTINREQEIDCLNQVSQRTKKNHCCLYFSVSEEKSRQLFGKWAAGPRGNGEQSPQSPLWKWSLSLMDLPLKKSANEEKNKTNVSNQGTYYQQKDNVLVDFKLYECRVLGNIKREWAEEYLLLLLLIECNDL
jgi:hypothetical protein